MIIELKNVKHAAFASQATACFEASIYVDGKKAGSVENSGRGGAHLIRPWVVEQQLSEYAKTLPELDITGVVNDGESHTMAQTAESLIDELLDNHLQAMSERRMCAKSTLFRIPLKDYKDGMYNVIKGKFTPETKAFLVNKYGKDVVILNEKYVK